MRLTSTFISIILAVFLSIDAGMCRDDHPRGLLADLATGSPAAAKRAADRLAKYPVDSLKKWIAEFDAYPVPERVGVVIDRARTIDDSLAAPYYIYVPTGYDPSARTPLVIYLHGGVNRPDFIEDPDDYLAEHPVKRVCEDQGWLGLFPMARRDCLWWNRTGMDHINLLVRELKREFNIDDDRVVLCGFSDGGSGSYHLAMLQPTDFALFFPWSGHMAVGSQAGGMQVYLLNMRCRPLFPVNGGLDGLYPVKRMLPLIRSAVEHGVDLAFTSYDTARHNAGYLKEELPRFVRRVKSMPRRPFAPSLYWEASDVRCGRVDWLEITALDTSRPPAEWHRDVNTTLCDDRITFGFMPDMEFEGEGVRVASVSEAEYYPAKGMGLRAGDVIVSVDETPVKSAADLNAAKRDKKRGDDVTLTVQRDGETSVLTGRFPPIREYAAFPRGRASGAVKAVRLGNRFEISASRVGRLSVYIHPEMVRLDQPVVVTVDGRKVFDRVITPDPRLMLDSFVADRDRRLLWVAKIDVLP